MNSEPQITRVRHELKRRRLTVVRVETAAPNMARVVLGGDELRGFTPLGFDDHIKLFFTDVTGAPALRDFTPRHFDAAANELWVDFFLHDAGPATAWAAQAKPGQTLEIGGPKGSAVLSNAGLDAHVMIGDETALPAMGRRLDELPTGARALVVLLVDEIAGWPKLTSRPGIDTVLVPRTAGSLTPGEDLVDHLRLLQFPPGNCFVWVAMESQLARTVRRYLVEERAIGKKWVKAAGYWRKGAVGAHDKIADED